MPRRMTVALLTVWPGLAQIWTGQEILGLLLATGFATAVNLALVSRFIWTAALPARWTDFFQVIALGLWGIGAAYTAWWVWRCHPDRHRLEIDTLVREAQESYLQGRWNDARTALERLLALDETDVDALMMLGSLLVRTGQLDGARRAYRQCLDLEGGAKWRWEIEQALGRIARLESGEMDAEEEPSEARAA